MARQLLDEVRAAGERGLGPEALNDPARKQNFEALARMGLLRIGDGLILEEGVYRRLAEAVRSAAGERGDIPLSTAKEATGVSRRILLTLLGWMETDGLLERRGDVRYLA